MKRKITYILTTAAITLAAFFIGRNTSPELTREEIIQKSCDYITYWEITDNGIDFYDADGNVYKWR